MFILYENIFRRKGKGEFERGKYGKFIGQISPVAQN